MPYRYAHNDDNYEIYAAGGVIYAAPGHTAFPVRLGDEIFRRCMALWDHEQQKARCTLYDPCCGSAYLLTTVALRNWDRIDRVIGSDIHADALSFAARNLSLLTMEGLETRIRELGAMAEAFGKTSHALALEHAALLKQHLHELTAEHPIEGHVFRADATDPDAIDAGMAGATADIVITDIPYDQRTQWSSSTLALATSNEPVSELLEALLSSLSAGAVVAVVSPKRVQAGHHRYKQVGKLKLGKRQVVFFQPT